MSLIQHAVGVWPLGHHRLRPRLAVAAAAWVLAVVALPLSIAAGKVVSVAFAAEMVFLAAYLTAMVVTVQLLRSQVAIDVTAGEVHIGDLRLPRASVRVTVEPAAVVLRVPGHDPVRLVATNRRAAWPGTGRNAEALVPRVMLARLAAELTGSPPADQAFGLVTTGRGWWRHLSPLLGAVAVIGVVNVAVGLDGTAGLAVAAVLDVAAFSVAALLVAVRAWPRLMLRMLIVSAGEVSVVEVHSGRLVERQARIAVTAQRSRWRHPPARGVPAVVREGVRLDLGGEVLDIGFQEPAGGLDPAPMMPVPRWMTEPGEGDRLIRALTRR